ncbi:metallophosphoesterase [Pilimelia columellifera]|uniref:metallophosphoesterase n=1 Tax=Pilimelia columellifera TaxID=706574 RepID=UPI0031D1F7BC
MLGFVVFISVVLLLVAGIHLYLWQRLVRDTTTAGGRARRVGSWAAFALAVSVPALLIGGRSGIGWLAWGYVWIAVMFYLLVALVVLELPMALARWQLRKRSAGAATSASASASASDHDPERRLLLARGAAIVAGLTATGVTAYGLRSALGPPRIARAQVPIGKLPRGMDGFRIATVSDIHLGPLAGRAHTERIVAMINQLDADVVAIVGDLVDGSVGELGPAAAPLGNLRSRHGAYFVTGNHEYFSGAQQWIDELPRLGIRVLANQRQAINGLDLAGVHDVAGETEGMGPDFDAALGDRDPARPVVLLAHQPIQASEAASRGVDLQLSGHTHGGQMAPFNLLVKLQQPVVSGLGEVDGMPLFVTNGAGFWGPPVRVGAPPEIALVQLRSA